MIWLLRSVLLSVLATVMLHFPGFALAEPMPDPTFFVRWADSGNHGHLFGVHFTDARTGWAVGEAGMIMTTRDGGASWAAQQSGTDNWLSGVYFADASTGWPSWRRRTAAPTG
jgi:hypothetical protein